MVQELFEGGVYFVQRELENWDGDNSRNMVAIVVLINNYNIIIVMVYSYIDFFFTITGSH